MKEFIENNKQLWNGWAAINSKSEFYNVAGFKKGKTALKKVELQELGNVQNKSLLHLQCHFGLDTLSWADEYSVKDKEDKLPLMYSIKATYMPELAIKTGT